MLSALISKRWPMRVPELHYAAILRILQQFVPADGSLILEGINRSNLFPSFGVQWLCPI